MATMDNCLGDPGSQVSPSAANTHEHLY